MEGQGTSDIPWLGAAWSVLGTWHHILSTPSTCGTGMEAKRQQVPDYASMGRSCPLPPKGTSRPLGRSFQQHKAAVASGCFKGGQRWFEQMSISALATGGSHRLTEISDKRPLKPIVCVKWIRQKMSKQALLPPMAQQIRSLWPKHLPRRHRSWDKDSLSVPFTLSKGTRAPLPPGKDQPPLGVCSTCWFTQPSGA